MIYVSNQSFTESEFTNWVEKPHNQKWQEKKGLDELKKKYRDFNQVAKHGASSKNSEPTMKQMMEEVKKRLKEPRDSWKIDDVKMYLRMLEDHNETKKHHLYIV